MKNLRQDVRSPGSMICLILKVFRSTPRTGIVRNVWIVKLTTHVLVILRLWMRGALYPRLIYVFATRCLHTSSVLTLVRRPKPQSVLARDATRWVADGVL
jgi:hypothetical protein